MRRWIDGRRAEIVAALLASSVVGSALAIGSVHVATVLVVAPFPILAGLLAMHADGDRPHRLPAPALVALALAAYSLLQLVPIPASVLRWAAPKNADVWSGSLRLLDLSANWIPVSMDPGATAVEALKWTIYAAGFCSAVFVARAMGRGYVLAIPFASALTVSFVTLTHKTFGLSKLYGLYAPEFARPSFALSPLLNANNLAAYLNLGAFAGLGLILSRRNPPLRWFLGFGVSIIVAVSALSASRGGWLSLVLGMALLSVALFVTRRARRSRRHLSWLLPVVPLVGGMVLFLLGASRQVWSALREEGLTKLDLIAWSGPMIADHPWLGVGRGAFDTAFPPYRQDFGHHLYAHAENFVAQWCAEWGVIVATASLAAFAWLLNPRRLGAIASPAAAAVYVGLTIFLVHNLVDLALELPAVGLVAFTTAGALWGASPSTARVALGPRATIARPLLGVVGGLTFVLAVATGMRPAIAERRDLSARVENLQTRDPSQHRELLREIGSAIRRHPADPFLPLLASITAYRAGENPLPWLGRAIERDPHSGRPHLVLARVLRSQGHHPQALLAVRMAVERDFALTGRGAELALDSAREFDDLIQAVPHGVSGVTILVEMARRSPDRAELRGQLLEEAMRRDPTAARPMEMRAEDLLRLLESQKCKDCDGRVREIAQALERTHAESDRSAIYLARLLLHERHDVQAEQLLARRCASRSEHLDCLRLRVVAANRLSDAEPLRKAVATYMDVACASAQGCGVAGVWVGDRLAARGDWATAARVYELAAQQSNDPTTWERLARAATHSGNDALALKAWRKAGFHRKSQ